jgi:branched-chain amino acid transport system ATP-binding protein
MEAIVPIADKLVVLDGGMKIAEGPPEQITSDERVIAAYLGAKFSRRLKARKEERPHA